MHTMLMKVPKRLQRPETPPPLQLTERDQHLVRLVAAYRFADSDQLFRFVSLSQPTSHQKIRRRLQALHSHRFLNRPLSQHVQLAGLAPLVYSIGTRGLRLLRSSSEPIDQRALWAAKASRTATQSFLNHALGVTETMLNFAAAANMHTHVVLIDQPTLVQNFPEATRALEHPTRLRLTLKDGFETLAISLVPDRLLALDYRDGRRPFALEFDTGSEPIVSQKLTKSSFGKKLRGYLAAYDQGRFRSQWGFERLRILTVTCSETRIKGMLDALHDISGGRLSQMFVFTTAKRLIEHGALSPIWISTDGDAVSLLPKD